MLKRILLLFTCVFICVAGAMAAGKRFTLVIDAGHGGKDAGAIGAISKEKDINLSVALAFGRQVERRCPEVKVVYTRKTDVFIPLMERANIANRNKADLFISVHTNALPVKKKAFGFETYTLGMHRAKDNLDVAKRENSVILVEKNYKQTYKGFDPKSSESYIMFELIQGQNMEKSVDLARMIQNKVCAQANRPNKGVHQAGFLVLRETSMPSCLIELGFITTPEEERLLNQESTVNSIARGIYNAFVEYKNKYDKSFRIAYEADDNTPRQGRDTERQPMAEPKVEKPVVAERVSDGGSDNIKAEGETDERLLAKVEKTVERSEGKVETKEATRAPEKSVMAKEEIKGAPVFKVQILTSSRIMRPDDNRLQGLKDCEYYMGDNVYKYTYGQSTNYNEIYRLRKSILDKFPEAFIIAFKDGERTDVNKAIKEFLNNKKR